MSIRRCAIGIFVAALPQCALAANWLDYIRSYDLNNYSLGVATTVSASPYVGTENSVIAYPYLTSFESNMLNDDWLIFTDGDAGFRWISDSGWMLGAVGRINTLGFGPERAEELEGLEDRQWSLELAPLIGFRGWPVQFELKPYWEMTGRHSGFNTQLLASLPIGHSRGWIAPQLRVSYRDASYTSYYFGVSEEEATPERPAYAPGASTDIAARLHWGYRLTDKWLLKGRFAYEWLGEEISKSPIVEEDGLWSVNLGIAYNADIFRPRDKGDTENLLPGLEFRVGLLRDHIDTEIQRATSDGFLPDSIDLEDVFRIADQTSLAQFDVIWRINRFHRLNLGYFELSRKGSAILDEDQQIGDAFFPAGTEVDSKMQTRTAQLSYAYALMSDSQKELGVSAGLHVTQFDARFESLSGDAFYVARFTAPLPVIGAQGSVSFGPRTSLGLKVQIFRLDADQYSGQLNYINLGLEHVFVSRISAGIGYQVYDLNLESDSDDLRGKVAIRHHGPFIFAGISFN